MTSPKLTRLRAEMDKLGIHGFFVPRADEFQGEYVPASNARLEWASGFSGSAGLAVIMKDKAAFFTDGRYTLQARAEVDGKDFEIYSTSKDQEPTPTLTPDMWIEKNLPKGAAFGIDPWLHTPGGLRKIETSVAKAEGTLVLLDKNPLDAAWEDRPPAPLHPAVPHPLEFAGRDSKAKRADVAAALREKGASALAVTLPEEICWLFNIRGSDVPCTPFALSYAIAHADGTADWFIDARKVPDETRKWVGPDVRIHPFGDFTASLTQAAGKGKIWVDPMHAPVRAENIVLEKQAAVVSERSPIQLMKATKNETEIAGTIRAHIRDGVAETRFLAALSAPGAVEKLDEISASDLLEGFRAEGERFKGLSFETISGAGGNGAIVHYRASEKTRKPLSAGPVYLVDSGAQYLDGTTDITRTIAVGPVTDEMKDRYTRVLQGHIRVAMAVFPEGTAGAHIDDLARGALKEVGCDYAHGTGHGVGSYLSVHEGPCYFGINQKEPIRPGMIISNEPGFYKEGEYGIRIENLVLVIDTGKTDKDGKRLLGFKTLTQAPIDRALIEPSLMTAEERAWLNAYHAEVRENLLPLLEEKDPAAAGFLKEATTPLPFLSPKGGED